MGATRCCGFLRVSKFAGEPFGFFRIHCLSLRIHCFFTAFPCTFRFLPHHPRSWAFSVWMFGDESEAAIVKVMRIREQIRPYVMKQYEAAGREGTPIMRPLFFDFHNDTRSEAIDDQQVQNTRKSQHFLACHLSCSADSWRMGRFLTSRTKHSTKYSHVLRAIFACTQKLANRQ